MRSGVVIPVRCISLATWIISSSEGVIRPERPMISTDMILTKTTHSYKTKKCLQLLDCFKAPNDVLPAFSLTAVSIILSHGVITPRSITLEKRKVKLISSKMILKYFSIRNSIFDYSVNTPERFLFIALIWESIYTLNWSNND